MAKNVKILVMGAGAIGSLFGGLIADVGHDVLLVGRKKHVEKIKEKGLCISGLTEKIIKVKATTSPRNIEADFILFTVKSYDTEEAVKELSLSIKNNTIVISMQNGLGNEEKIANVIGFKHVISGVTSYGALFKEPGHIIHSGIGYTALGELDGKITERLREISDIFNNTGIETEISTDIRRKKWEKLVINAAINPITAIARVKNKALLGEGFRWIMEEAVIEAVSVAKKEKMAIYDDIIEKVREVAERTAENESSMLQDIKRGRKTEIEAINGEIVRKAEKKGLYTPVNKTLYQLVKSIEGREVCS